MVAANDLKIITPGLLTREQLAAELGVGIRTVDHWIHTGIYNGVRLRVVHAGRLVRIRRADYAAFQAEIDKRRGTAERDRRLSRQESGAEES